MALRRVRGALLRLVRRRGVAMAVGAAIAAPALWIELAVPHDAWWLDGLSLVLLGTGIAIAWTGLTGPSPDWLDDDN